MRGIITIKEGNAHQRKISVGGSVDSKVAKMRIVWLSLGVIAVIVGAYALLSLG